MMIYHILYMFYSEKDELEKSGLGVVSLTIDSYLFWPIGRDRDDVATRQYSRFKTPSI